MNSPARLQQGFSLIEVLVTLVLVAIGLLGMVGLQGRAIQYTQDSVQRNSAAMLANDLVELIRARPDGLPGSSGFYKAKGTTFPTAPASCFPMPSAAAEQLACWGHNKVVDVLPDAASLLDSEYYVCRTNKPGECTNSGETLEIQIAWRVRSGDCLDAGAGDGDDLTICRYRLMTRI